MSSIDSQEYDVVVDDQMERYQILGQRGSRAIEQGMLSSETKRIFQ